MKQKSIRDFRGRFKKKRYASPAEARAIFDRMYARGEAEREAHLRTPAGEAERQTFNRRTLERLRMRENPRATVGRRYHVIVAPYSLAANRVGEPTVPETVVTKHSSLIAARNKLGSLISGKGKSVVSAIVPRGDGYRIFVRDSQTGEEMSRTGKVITMKRNPRKGREIVRGAFVGRVEAGKGTLLGGVKVHSSSPFDTREEAQAWLDAVLQGNRQAGRDIARSYVSPAKVYRAKRNPVGKFYISGHSGKRTWYYRHSTQSFTDAKEKGTAYRSRAHAESIAKSLLRRLPQSIETITVKP